MKDKRLEFLTDLIRRYGLYEEDIILRKLNHGWIACDFDKIVDLRKEDCKTIEELFSSENISIYFDSFNTMQYEELLPKETIQAK